ncbi:MAG: circularly permuted type 2 ATP-grasp protein [Frisingicoccus sp.]
MKELRDHIECINDLLARYGVRFGLYKNGEFKEQLFPFDPIPRIIPKAEFERLERGLIQRVKALNCFLQDIYSEKRIVADGVIPESFVFSSSGFLPECDGIHPVHGIYSHISGIDLVEGKDGEWYILEDNLRIPSGASYPLIARNICRRASPGTFSNNAIADNRDYAKMLKEMMDYVNTGGINVILTPGRYNAAFFEHSYLAEKTYSILAVPSDLYVENDVLYYKDYSERPKRVGAVYRRISDEYMDPMVFNPESVIGVPGIMSVYKAGNVALINAPGNGIGDDKGIYYFVPKMIEYYLNEKPVLKNAPTYLPYFEKDRKYVLDNLERLVIKDVAEAGGYGVIFGKDLEGERLEEMRQLIQRESRRFIAQEVIDFKDLEIVEGGGTVERKADLRAFVLYGKEVKVWKSGLTRFSRNPDSFVVNSSREEALKTHGYYLSSESK